MSQAVRKSARIKVLPLVGINIALLLIGWAILVAIGRPSLIESYVLGWAFSQINLILIWWLWRLVFAKKFIALAVFVIVLKYAFLGYVLFKISTQSWIQPLAFAFGVLSLGVSITVFGLTYRKLRS